MLNVKMLNVLSRVKRTSKKRVSLNDKLYIICSHISWMSTIINVRKNGCNEFFFFKRLFYYIWSTAYTERMKKMSNITGIYIYIINNTFAIIIEKCIDKTRNLLRKYFTSLVWFEQWYAILCCVHSSRLQLLYK